MSGLDGIKKLKTDANASSSLMQEEEDSFEEQDEQEGQDIGEAEDDGPEVAAAGINPLENSLILNHLFKLCPASILANCRLVCRQWHEESLATWRTDFPIQFTNRLFHEKCRLVLFVNSDVKRELDLPNVPLKQFLEYCADPQNQCATKPFRNISIECPEFSSHPEDIIQLWATMGINLKTLDLSGCGFNDGEEFRTIIFTTCPNLQSLKLVFCTFTGRKDTHVTMLEYREPLHGKQHYPLKSLQVISTLLPISWLELFSNFQSLAHFSFEFDKTDYCAIKGVLEGFPDAVRTVRKNNPKALPFKFLDIHPPPDISLLEPILQTKTGIELELRLPIRSLCINSEMMEAHVKHVLEFNAERLERIKVTGKDPGLLGHSFPCGVQLGKLTTLNIKEYLCENLEFLKYTPNLKYLAISSRYDITTTETHFISNSCKQEMATIMGTATLKELKISCVLTDTDLAILFEWLPNLASLELVLNDRQFGIACGKWKNLKYLSSRGWGLSDAGVTGIENLGKTDSDDESESDEEKEDDPPKLPTRPNITDLQNLEKFTFWSWHITAKSVFHGFCQTPRLREIEFCSDDRRDELEWKYEANIALGKRKIELVEPQNSPYWH